jgi:lipopolysaccharide transport system permease protein
MLVRLIFEFTKRDFTERYAGSLLGIFWAFIWPLVMIAIYTIVFSNIMGASIKPGMNKGVSYVIYLVAGIVPWTSFVNTVVRSSTVFIDKKNIITKIRASLPTLPLYIVLSESITFCISICIYVLFLLSVGYPIYQTILFLPFIFIIQQIFAYGLGLLLGVLYVFVRDIKELTNIVLQLWFWLTPIVYVIDIIPDFLKKGMQWNPAYFFINAYHDIFVYGRFPDFYHLMALTCIGPGVLFVAYILVKKLEKDMRDFI